MFSFFISGYFGPFRPLFLIVLNVISGVISDAIVISGDKMEPCPIERKSPNQGAFTAGSQEISEVFHRTCHPSFG